MTDSSDIVTDSQQISLRRDPDLSRALVAQYEYVESEQDAIRRAMRERVRWGQKGLTPEGLLERVVRLEGTIDGGGDGDEGGG